MISDLDARRDAVWLRWSIALVWLVTGLMVFHPDYRRLGHAYLQPLGLPDEVMYATCIAEVLLGLRVALGPASLWITVLQMATIVSFTSLLAVSAPELFLAPEGYLLKNLPLLAMLGSAWLLEREGRTPRARWLLLGGLAAYWLLKGVLTYRILAVSGVEVGLAMMMVGVRGWALRGVLLVQMAILAYYPLRGVFEEPLLWTHPFGAASKSVALMGATWVVWRQNDILKRS